jgi:hypothetical protein
MGSSLTLIQLPAQSGKTRKMTDLINKWNSTFNISKSNDLNIIFTSNTKLLNKQTQKRIAQDVDNCSSSDDDVDTETSDSPKTLSWTANTMTRDGKRKMMVDNVFALITSDDDDEEIDNIICCTNKKRMQHVVALLEMLIKKYRKRNFNREVNIWIDEADSSVGIWSEHFNTLSAMCAEKFVKNIVLITATMRPVYKYLHSIDVEPLLRQYENTHAPVYHKYSECNLIHNISDANKRADDALVEVLKAHPEMVVPGSRWFCPGNTKCASHEEHCRILMDHGFNVLIINGVYKEFRLLNGDVIPITEDLEEDLEVAKTLSRYYFDNELYNAPFAVTGKMCVSRGITFASSIDGNEFLFTHGVIPNNTNGDDAYQMVMRCGGNIKGFNTYQVPTLFVSTKTSDLILNEERLAVEFAKKYWNGEEDQTICVTPGMLKESFGTRFPSVHDIAGTVPKIVQLSDEEYNSINKVKRAWNEERIMELINEYDPELCMELMNMEKDQITEPDCENSRKKHIDDIVSGAEQNKKKTISIKKDLKNKDVFQIFMDNVNHRLIVTRYYGSRLA